MSKSQGEFPSPKKLCRALHSAPSCRNTVADNMHAGLHSLVGNPSPRSECIMLKLNNLTSFTFHSYHYHHAELCLRHHQEAALVTASTNVFS